MRLPTLRRTRAAEPGTISGPVRLDRRTKRLAARLRPGDIAVIDHVDIDRIAADSLIAVGVVAVLNAKPSISGRYPNLGPDALVKAGIVLLDDLGEDVFRQLSEGTVVREKIYHEAGAHTAQAMTLSPPQRSKRVNSTPA